MKHDWLAHYGVQGQKWGVKHGPPYPLDRGIYNRAKKEEPNISKDKKVPLYEEVRNPIVTAKRKIEIVKLMNELADSVKDPDDILKIKEH